MGFKCKFGFILTTKEQKKYQKVVKYKFHLGSSKKGAQLYASKDNDTFVRIITSHERKKVKIQ